MTVLAAIVAGFVGGAFHLLLTAVRAREVGRGRLGVAVVLAPAGLVGPVAAVLATLQVAPDAVWAVLPGLIAARLLLVGPLSREDRWTR